MLLSSRSIQCYSVAPYLDQLYRDDLDQKIQHPAAVLNHRCALPLLLRKAGKIYFIPGNLDDLIRYTSAVAACAEAILRVLSVGGTEAVGSPSEAELVSGVIRRQSSLRPAWRLLNTEVRQRLANGETTLVADIASCSASINLERLHVQLVQISADRAAVHHLHTMHQCWRRSGCHGLPLTGGFWLLLELYLADVDDRLRRQGIDFIRLQDDFRIFCRSSGEADQACGVLQETLSACGMRINPAKTGLIKPGPRASWLVQRQAIKHLFGRGVGLPLLEDMLQVPALRPLALLLLRRFHGHQCRPIAELDSGR